jgi:amino acid adenylation domain-containing protein
MNQTNVEDLYPLSPMQEGMLLHALLSPDTGIYIEQMSCELHGDLDVKAFQHAWQTVLDRHPILRTGFLWKDLDRPLQLVARHVDLPLELRDWRGLSSTEQATSLDATLAEDRQRGFDLETPPAMRLALMRQADDAWLFLWSHHHLLLDGWSIPILFEEVFKVYHAVHSGIQVILPQRKPFRDYIAWLETRDETEAESFWRAELSGFSGATYPARAAALATPCAFDEIELRLSPEETRLLTQLAHTCGVTMNTLVGAAWALTISRFSAENEVLFGQTVSGRPDELPGAEEMIGMFINTLPVRVSIPAAMRVRDWLKDLQMHSSRLRQYEYTPLARIQEWSERGGKQPLFETILVYENYPGGEALEHLAADVKISAVHSYERTNYPLTLVAGTTDQLVLKISYATNQIQSARVWLLLHRLTNLLNAFARTPDLLVTELPSGLDDSIEQATHGPQCSIPAGTVVDWIAAQAARSPDAIALRQDEIALTYAQLMQRAAAAACALQTHGVRREECVAVCLERSPDLIACILGILQAGAAFIPLDPAYPAERLNALTTDAGVRLVFARSRSFPAREGLCVIDPVHLDLRQAAAIPLDPPLSGQDLAYVLYTSGTTGMPKGVMIEHRALANNCASAVDRFAIDAHSRVMQLINITFDPSLEEIFPCLSAGGQLVLAEPDYAYSGRSILAACEQYAITLLHLPVAIWHQIVEEILHNRRSVPTSLEITVVGGEQPNREDLQVWMQAWEPARTPQHARRIRFFNAYGPTETTVTATLYELPENWKSEDMLPIGRPIANTAIHVLRGENGRTAATGEPGEIYIAGAGVARGYLHRDEETAAHFLEIAGARAYRTGDMGWWREDGQLVFAGRRDEQVKIRGFRVELGEIESTLQRIPGIHQAAVLASGSGSEKTLIAWVTGEPASAASARTTLAQTLPAHMLPQAIHWLPELPVTSNGKIDRRKLASMEIPTPTGAPSSITEATLENETERELARIWQDILGRTDIHRDDDFFDLGGHSLRAARLLAQINAIWGLDLPLRGVFSESTLRAQAAWIRGAQHGRAYPAIEKVERGGELLLSYPQQRLWFIDQLEPGSAYYNIPSTIRLHRALDPDLFERSLLHIISRHEILRTRLISRAGQPRQEILPSMDFKVEKIDLRSLPAAQKETTWKAIARSEAQIPFNLTRPPLLRVRLIRLEEEEWMILLTAHHVVVDGWSLDIFLREVSQTYIRLENNQEPDLPALPVQYADYAAWQRRYLQDAALRMDLDYWKEQLAGAPGLLELPTDHARPSVKTSSGGTVSFTIGPELLGQLRQILSGERVTLYMLLLAAFQVLLYRYSGQDDILVGSASANRPLPELENLIGCFANMLVMRGRLEGNPRFCDFLSAVRETALAAYAHQDAPFEMIVDALQPERSLSYTPVFQVGFDVRSPLWSAQPSSAFNAEGVETDSGIAIYDLLLSIQEQPGGLQGSLEYCTDLFERARIERMITHYLAILASICADVEEPVDSLNLLSEEERHRLLVDWNQTAAPEPPGGSVLARFHEAAAAHPKRIAVEFEQQALTYQELDRQTDILAAYLRGVGIEAETPIGVMTTRSPELVIAILGILKAGGAYLPLDLTYPIERLQFMLQDSGTHLVITQKEVFAETAWLPCQALCLDTHWDQIKTLAQKNSLPPAPAPEQLAYIIYTSGSTGKPKGTALEHRGLANLSCFQQRTFDIDGLSRILQFSPLSFDASVWEVFMALANGATLVLAPRDRIANPIELARLLQEKRITTVTLPPSMLSLLPNDDLPDLRTVIAAGEACSREIVARWARGRSFFNAYGPTETTVCATIARIEATPAVLADERIPIGHPIDNFQAYILNRAHRPVPTGVSGELCIGGIGVARGYLNRPELNREKFISDPFSRRPGARLYCTGDRVRYRPDGSLEFLGRMDDQVKVRGFRIELGEVEAELRACPEIRDAAVVVRAPGTSESRLEAFVVYHQADTQVGGDGDSETVPAQEATIRARLRARLPEYMIPSVILSLPALPLSPSGKIDRKALLAQGSALLAQKLEQNEAEFTPPSNEIERQLVQFCSELLDLERVSVSANFFEIGGHSLLATQLVSRIREEMNVELPLRALFEQPTITALAEAICALQADGQQTRSAPIPRASRAGRQVRGLSNAPQTEDEDQKKVLS